MFKCGIGRLIMTQILQTKEMKYRDLNGKLVKGNKGNQILGKNKEVN
jgi:hypothetical protein